MANCRRAVCGNIVGKISVSTIEVGAEVLDMVVGAIGSKVVAGVSVVVCVNTIVPCRCCDVSVLAGHSSV